MSDELKDYMALALRKIERDMVKIRAKQGFSCEVQHHLMLIEMIKEQFSREDSGHTKRPTR